MKDHCKCKCDCCKPNCEELLVKGHIVYKDSIDKFVEADNIMRDPFKESILYALSLIEKREELQKIAAKEENEALEILGVYEDRCTCNNNIEKCKPLLDEALIIFKVEGEKVQEIKEELLRILCLLDEYEKIAADGDYVFFEKWIPCLHSDKKC